MLAIKRVVGRPGDWVPFADGWLQLGDDEAWLQGDATDEALAAARARGGRGLATLRPGDRRRARRPGVVPLLAAGPHRPARARCGGVTRSLIRGVRSVDGEPALRVTYRMTLDVAGRRVKTAGTQLYIPRAGRLVLVTISVRAGHSADDVKQLVKGIQLLD